MHSCQTLDQHLKELTPFDRTFTKAPPRAVTENRLVTLRNYLMDIVKKAQVTSNLTSEQRSALKKIRHNDNLHFSVADKTSEFVVMKTEDHITATTAHLSNPNIYKELEMPSGDIETEIFYK